jgi:type IV secretion system protein VirB4
LALGPLALAFVGSTDKESIATIKNLCAQYGDRWVDQWLAMKGLKLSDDGVAA